MLSKIQLALMPLAFGFLLLLMLLYWSEAAFLSFTNTKSKKFSTQVFNLSFLSLTSILIIRWVESGHLPLSNLYESLLFLSWSFLLSQFVFKWTNNSHLFHQKFLLKSSSSLRNLEPTSLPLSDNFAPQSESIDLLGVVISPLALTSYAFAFLYLPKEMQKATSLVPALQSNWLMMHVTIMILSYAALLCGSIMSMAFLFIDLLVQKQSRAIASSTARSDVEDVGNVHSDSASWLRLLRKDQLPSFANNKNLYTEHRYAILEFALTASSQWKQVFKDGTRLKKSYTPISENISSKNKRKEVESLEKESDKFENTGYISQLRFCDQLDNYSYRMLGLGFALLTVGILSGAVWANSAWGSYWSWDPKETWALITWLVFAIYLHARITKGWNGQKAATIATIGFFVVWFCYLGVNLLGTGLHSYGWFNQ